MRNQNDNGIGATGISAAQNRTDPLSAREQAHYLRQVETVRFFRQAARMLIKPFVELNRHMTISRELSEKPDYILKDMGMSRWEIPAVVSGELGRKTLALSPVNPSSAPAFTSNEDDGDETTPLAA